MHQRILFFLAVLVLVMGTIAAPLAQAPSTPAALRARIDAIAKEIDPAIIEIRRDIHRHPELGFHETRTAGARRDAAHRHRPGADRG